MKRRLFLAFSASAALTIAIPARTLSPERLPTGQPEQVPGSTVEFM